MSLRPEAKKSSEQPNSSVKNRTGTGATGTGAPGNETTGTGTTGTGVVETTTDRPTVILPPNPSGTPERTIHSSSGRTAQPSSVAGQATRRTAPQPGAQSSERTRPRPGQTPYSSRPSAQQAAQQARGPVDKKTIDELYESLSPDEREKANGFVEDLNKSLQKLPALRQKEFMELLRGVILVAYDCGIPLAELEGCLEDVYRLLKYFWNAEEEQQESDNKKSAFGKVFGFGG